MAENVVYLHECLESSYLVEEDRPVYCFDISFEWEEHADNHNKCRDPVEDFDPNIDMNFALYLMIQLK